MTEHRSSQASTGSPNRGTFPFREAIGLDLVPPRVPPHLPPRRTQQVSPEEPSSGFPVPPRPPKPRGPAEPRPLHTSAPQAPRGSPNSRGPQPDGSRAPQAGVSGLPAPAELRLQRAPRSSLPSSRSADGRGPSRPDPGGLHTGPGKALSRQPPASPAWAQPGLLPGPDHRLAGPQRSRKDYHTVSSCYCSAFPRPQLAHLLNGRGVWGLFMGARDPPVHLGCTAGRYR